jgi:hypothetical protein
MEILASHTFLNLTKDNKFGEEEICSLEWGYGFVCETTEVSLKPKTHRA